MIWFEIAASRITLVMQPTKLDHLNSTLFFFPSTYFVIAKISALERLKLYKKNDNFIICGYPFPCTIAWFFGLY